MTSDESIFDLYFEYIAQEGEMTQKVFLERKGLYSNSNRARFSTCHIAANPEWQAMAKEFRSDSSEPIKLKSLRQRDLLECALQIYDRKNKSPATKPRKKRLANEDAVDELSNTQEKGGFNGRKPKKVRLTNFLAAKTNKENYPDEGDLMDLSEVGDSILAMVTVVNEAHSRFEKLTKLLAKERKARKKVSREARLLGIQLEVTSESLEEERNKNVLLKKENKMLRGELFRPSVNKQKSLQRSNIKTTKKVKRAHAVDKTATDSIQDALDNVRAVAQSEERERSGLQRQLQKAKVRHNGSKTPSSGTKVRGVFQETRLMELLEAATAANNLVSMQGDQQPTGQTA